MKTIALLTALFLTTGLAIGQDQKTEDERKAKHEKFKNMSPEEKAKHKTEKLDEVLDLSDDQAKKVEAITLEAATEMDAIHKEMVALKEKAKAARKKAKAEIEEILTDEQKTKMEAEHEKMKKKHEERKKEKDCHHQH